MGKHRGKPLENHEKTVDNVWKTMRKYTKIYEHIP
jgi:hypothetical protein